jgi:1-acyl-sn-glycerol-3-phosphate acyltransferase
MNAVRSALFALVFYPLTVVAVILAIAAIPAGQRILMGVVVGWAQMHRWCASVLLGIRSRVEGQVPREPMLIASKHQSMFETVELVLILDNPVPVIKRELADIPGFGWAARRYGVIPVDREAGAAALRRMTAAAHAARAHGRPIVIFPEGTRVSPGEQPAVRPGFAGLYRSLGLPCVPVALDSGRVWPRHKFIKRPGIVTMRFGEAIPPGLPRREIEARVHAAINALEPAPPPTAG